MKKKQNLILHIPTYLFVLLLSFAFFVFPTSVHAEEITISPKSITLGRGESATVTVKGADQEVKWEVRHKRKLKIVKTKKLAADTYSCTVQAVKGDYEYNSYLKATVGDKVYKCPISYEIRVQNEKSIHITKGNQKQLLISTKAPVKWTSSRKSVASVSKTGVVKGRKPGNATITAQVGKQKFKYKVKVSSKISDSKKYRYKIKKGEAIITSYIGDDDIVKIPKKLGGKKVTTIGYEAFGEDSEHISPYKPYTLKEVSIPKGVRSIGDWAFATCTYLTKVSLPSTLRTIGIQAFAEDESLKSIHLPSKLQSIAGSAFCYSGLTNIVIPNQIKIMQANVLGSCKNLTSVKLPTNLKIIEEYALCCLPKLRKIVIPNGTKEIQSDAFYNDVNLEQVIIPESVTTIAPEAFSTVPFTATFPPNLTIYGKAGSTAEKYANKYQIKFVAMK